MISNSIKELIPFLVVYFQFLTFFSLCYIVCSMDIDGEVDDNTPMLPHF